MQAPDASIIVPGRKAEVYTTFLKELVDGNNLVALPPIPAPETFVGIEDGDSAIIEDAASDDNTPPLPPAASSEDNASSDVGGEGVLEQLLEQVIDEDSGDVQDHVIEEVGEDGIEEWPTVLNGCMLTIDEHNGPTGRYKRLKIKCPLAETHPGHANCQKYRNINMGQDVLGPRAPLAFLGAWASQAGRLATKKDHVGHPPTLAEQRAWLRANA